MPDSNIGKYAFLFDFDGTLVEIADTPGNVAVPHGLGSNLVELRRLAGSALAIVTGRPIAEIDTLLAPHSFDVAGVHGTEFRMGSKSWKNLQNSAAAFRDAVSQLKQMFENRDGLTVEDKQSSIAVHWRLNPSLEPEVMNFIIRVSAGLGGAYRIQMGKAVAEIVPQSASKGNAIELILERQPYAGRIPLFFGDDLSDESGFHVVNRLGGRSIHVGSNRTIARHRMLDESYLRGRIAGWIRGRTLDPESDFA